MSTGRSRRRGSERASALCAATLLFACALAVADVPYDSTWDVAGTERVVARVGAMRFVQKGPVSSQLVVDASGAWSLDALQGTGHAITVGGSIEERRGPRFVPRMDDASKAAFGDAVRQIALDAGAAEARLLRVRTWLRGKERDDGTLRIRSVARIALRVRVRGRRATMALRATDLWTCTPLT